MTERARSDHVAALERVRGQYARHRRALIFAYALSLLAMLVSLFVELWSTAGEHPATTTGRLSPGGMTTQSWDGVPRGPADVSVTATPNNKDGQLRVEVFDGLEEAPTFTTHALGLKGERPDRGVTEAGRIGALLRQEAEAWSTPDAESRLTLKSFLGLTTLAIFTVAFLTLVLAQPPPSKSFELEGRDPSKRAEELIAALDRILAQLRDVTEGLGVPESFTGDFVRVLSELPAVMDGDPRLSRLRDEYVALSEERDRLLEETARLSERIDQLHLGTGRLTAAYGLILVAVLAGALPLIRLWELPLAGYAYLALALVGCAAVSGAYVLVGRTDKLQELKEDVRAVSTLGML